MGKLAETLVLVMNTVGMLPFLLMSGSMAPQSWPSIKEEECTGRGSRAVCVEALEMTVAKTYLQVIAASAFMFAAMIYAPGAKGATLAMLTIATIQLKARASPTPRPHCSPCPRDPGSPPPPPPRRSTSPSTGSGRPSP